MMHTQTGLSAAAGVRLATANYAGYLAGALICIAAPALARSRAALRGSLLVLVATLALMPVSTAGAWWWALRLLAGAASAVVFVIAVHTLLNGPSRKSASLAGWGFGGVGAGIAISGAAVLVVRLVGDWRSAWFVAAGLAVVLGALAWTLAPGPAAAPSGVPSRPGGARPVRRLQGWLLASYSLEGVGYIIAGTFLVAAIDQSSPGWVGTGAWVLAGLAAAPSAALWARLGHRFGRPDLLAAALLLQAVGIALPAIAAHAVAAGLASAVLFGATFVSVSQLSLAAGNQLGSPRSVAVLTTGYSVGQILGPIVVTPVLHHGYRPALLLGAAVVMAAAVAAMVLRAGWPTPPPEPVVVRPEAL
ncbi:YbfB/YjiJ family MFS transporter [Streptomyces sp. NPDC051020]|uniref:YbfB/YjiJ family MFS transporter n=1 Tax=Streptomyces sp. NPDC051020 TaxID=3155409 RepID=UPI00343A2C8A